MITNTCRKSETPRRPRAIWFAALFAIAVCFALPAGAQTDEALRARAEQDDVKAQVELGRMYFDQAHGDEEGAKWIRKAAEQGYAEAQFVLGWVYAEARGVKYDHVEAIRWYRKAAEQGHAMAQSALARKYANDRDGNYLTAYMWIMLALNGVAPDTRDYSWFVQIRDDIASHLTPSEIAEAERLADAFQAQPEICFAENNPVDAQFQFYFGMEISGFEQYPQDMKCFMAYAAACEHLAGEEGYDEERRQYLHDALNQYCPAAETRQIALKKKYEHNEEMQRVLSVYDRR